MVKNILELCSANNMTLTNLEKSLSFGHGTIARWKSNRPSIDKVKAVADFFGVTVDELIREQE